MATLRNKRKLAAVSRETQECPRNSQSQNSSATGITEQSIAQFFEEIEGRVTEKLSQEFSSRVPHHGRSVQARRISLEPTGTDILRSRFGNIPERWGRKPGSKWGSFLEWSPSWNGILCLLCQQPNWLGPGRDLSQTVATKYHFADYFQPIFVIWKENHPLIYVRFLRFACPGRMAEGRFWIWNSYH